MLCRSDFGTGLMGLQRRPPTPFIVFPVPFLFFFRSHTLSFPASFHFSFPCYGYVMFLFLVLSFSLSSLFPFLFTVPSRSVPFRVSFPFSVSFPFTMSLPYPCPSFPFFLSFSCSLPFPFLCLFMFRSFFLFHGSFPFSFYVSAPFAFSLFCFHSFSRFISVHGSFRYFLFLVPFHSKAHFARRGFLKY
jgi:hypothetical protein